MHYLKHYWQQQKLIFGKSECAILPLSLNLKILLPSLCICTVTWSSLMSFWLLQWVQQPRRNVHLAWSGLSNSNL